MSSKQQSLNTDSFSNKMEPFSHSIVELLSILNSLFMAMALNRVENSFEFLQCYVSHFASDEIDEPLRD